MIISCPKDPILVFCFLSIISQTVSNKKFDVYCQKTVATDSYYFINNIEIYNAYVPVYIIIHTNINIKLSLKSL